MAAQRLRYIFFIAIGIVAYYFLKFIPMGSFILYPFQLLATIMHEFGHGAFALLTGGEIISIQVNANGSGWTQTMGGSNLLIVAGGYIGSAIFGNLLLRAGLLYANWSNAVLYALLVIMVTMGSFWSASLINTMFMGLFAIATYLISRMRSEIASWFLIAMGILSILHIIEDFNVGPMSDLAQFTIILPILPQRGWMFVWLTVVIAITWINVKNIITRTE